MNTGGVAYNEIDPFACEMLRSAIKVGLIASGEVLECDIKDLTANDLRPFRQIHFFAGLGIWSYAARGAGWRDDRRLISGSCPCQPFSPAGEGGGFDDERHLWPDMFWLVERLRAVGWWHDEPVAIVGEQVANGSGLAWLDLVQSDMEGTGHAFGAVDSCAAGFGAPHLRQRHHWLANAKRRGERPGFRDIGSSEYGRCEIRESAQNGITSSIVPSSFDGGLADLSIQGLERSAKSRPARSRDEGSAIERNCDVGQLGNAGRFEGRLSEYTGRPQSAEISRSSAAMWTGPGSYGGPVNGAWRDADWLYCQDERWRPVEPFSFPLAHGIAGRMGLLRCYGNAIVEPQVRAFMRAVMDVVTET